MKFNDLVHLIEEEFTLDEVRSFQPGDLLVAQPNVPSTSPYRVFFHSILFDHIMCTTIPDDNKILPYARSEILRNLSAEERAAVKRAIGDEYSAATNTLVHF